MDERREHQRYRPEETCILNYESSVGTIIDICMGGLSCKCLEQNKCCQDSSERAVNIFCKKNKLFAQGLPIKILGSKVLPGEYVMDVKVRICRAQFEQLKDEQKTYLEEIILSYAIH